MCHCSKEGAQCLCVICSVSSLAWFMSNQETSFVTIGQRLLANPLRSVSSTALDGILFKGMLTISILYRVLCY